jgi:hypothetical protein
MGLIVADEIASKETPGTLLPAAYVCMSRFCTKIVKDNGQYLLSGRFDIFASKVAKLAGGTVIETIEVGPIAAASYPANPSVLLYARIKQRYAAENVYDDESDA